jgi:sialate O-acetylesterase
MGMKNAIHSARFVVLNVLTIASFLAVAPLQAKPVLPHLFSDHMVLQRDREIPIWGWADPGENITVTFAGASKQVVAGANSRWRVVFPALSAVGPFALEVRGTTSIVIKDVLIGEVWVASGQSNMAFALSGAANAATEIPKANDPNLRFFTVPKRVAITPQTDTLPVNWEICTSDTAKKFSAVAYFFARELRRALGVPVGVILSSWPGTQAEEWTDAQSLGDSPILQPILTRWNNSPSGEKEFAARPRDFSLEFDDFKLIPADTTAPPAPFSDFDDGASRTHAGGNWTYSWEGTPDSRFELVAPGHGGKGYAAKVSGQLDGASDSYLRASFKEDGTPYDASSFAGVRFWMRGQGSYVFRTLQPSIYDWDDYSTQILQATPEWKQVTIWLKDLKQAGWGVREELTLNQLTGFSITCLTDLGDTGRPPSGLYNGMIAPLVTYPIRGAIWYQGEGNTYRAFQYRTLLPAMISGWRKGWNEGDFPFLIVQLPNQGSTAEFIDSWWAELREAQLLTAQNIANVGLAITIDVGDPKDLHPPRKEEVGARLALWALGTTYGKKIEYSGPIYTGMKVEGGEIRIRFKHVGSGLQLPGDTLRGFSIAGSDKKFSRATARMEGNVVIVSSPDVREPVAVRYDWADSPEGNLYNGAGLPASPFRTDDWPGATYTNR